MEATGYMRTRCFTQKKLKICSPISYIEYNGSLHSKKKFGKTREKQGEDLEEKHPKTNYDTF